MIKLTYLLILTFLLFSPQQYTTPSLPCLQIIHSNNFPFFLQNGEIKDIYVYIFIMYIQTYIHIYLYIYAKIYTYIHTYACIWNLFFGHCFAKHTYSHGKLRIWYNSNDLFSCLHHISWCGYIKCIQLVSYWEVLNLCSAFVQHK